MKAILVNKDPSVHIDHKYYYVERDIVAKLDILSMRFPTLIYHEGQIYKHHFNGVDENVYYLTYCYGLPKIVENNDKSG